MDAEAVKRAADYIYSCDPDKPITRQKILYMLYTMLPDRKCNHMLDGKEPCDLCGYSLEDRIFTIINEGIHDTTACNIRAIAKGVIKALEEK